MRRALAVQANAIRRVCTVAPTFVDQLGLSPEDAQRMRSMVGQITHRILATIAADLLKLGPAPAPDEPPATEAPSV
jgi:hypothetical protein